MARSVRASVASLLGALLSAGCLGTNPAPVLLAVLDAELAQGWPIVVHEDPEGGVVLPDLEIDETNQTIRWTDGPTWSPEAAVVLRAGSDDPPRLLLLRGASWRLWFTPRDGPALQAAVLVLEDSARFTPLGFPDRSHLRCPLLMSLEDPPGNTTSRVSMQALPGAPLHIWFEGTDAQPECPQGRLLLRFEGAWTGARLRES